MLLCIGCWALFENIAWFMIDHNWWYGPYEKCFVVVSTTIHNFDSEVYLEIHKTLCWSTKSVKDVLEYYKNETHRIWLKIRGGIALRMLQWKIVSSPSREKTTVSFVTQNIIVCTESTLWDIFHNINVFKFSFWKEEQSIFNKL